MWIGLAAGTITLVIIVLGAMGSGAAGAKVDTADWEQKISAGLTEQTGVSVTVDCPDGKPLKDGYIFDCVASDGTDERMVRVTQDDAHGHFTYELTTQKP